MSVNELFRAVNQNKKIVEPHCGSSSVSLSSNAHHQQASLKTPQSKYGAAVLISATATRINGRIAITPRSADEAPCTLTSGDMRRTENSSKAATPLKASAYSIGRRLPMNMVVSQVACRRSSSPVREMKERLVSEPPPLDPLLDHLLNFKTPGPKTGSLPHPDNLMGSRSRKFRRIEGPEDDIHKAFLSIYGDAEASLSVGKKLRLIKNNDNEDPLIEEANEDPFCHTTNTYKLPIPSNSFYEDVESKDRHSPDIIPSSLESNSHYQELYGTSDQRTCEAVALRTIEQPSVESWISQEAALPPRKFVSSHHFLKTASKIYSERTTNEKYNFVTQQESIWKKYLNEEEKVEDENPWVIESLGNSNQHHQNNNGKDKYTKLNDMSDKKCIDINYDFKFSPLLPSEQEFNFVPCSPAKPGPSPTLGQKTRVQGGNDRRQDLGGTAGMPESAECRWLYESSPSYKNNRSRHDDPATALSCPQEETRDEYDKDDDEVSSLFQTEKESLFSSSTECDREDYYNYSPEE